MKFVLSCLLLVVILVCGDDDLRMSRIISQSRCNLDSECQENSFCFGNDGINRGLCRCLDGFIIFQNRTFYECLLPAETKGSPCDRHSQCRVVLGNPSGCYENKCDCSENAHFVEVQNQCYLTSRPGEICQNDFNCLLYNGTKVNCFVGRCKCPILHHHTDDGRCVRSANLGEVCDEHDACRHTFADCYDVCRCIGGYAPSTDGVRCLLAAETFGGPCEEHSQCSEYLMDSFCQEDSTCGCHLGFHGIGTRCWRDVAAGGMCTDRRECFIRNNTMENVGCIDGVCTCLEGFNYYRGHCVSGSESSYLIFKRLLIGLVFFVLILTK